MSPKNRLAALILLVFLGAGAALAQVPRSQAGIDRALARLHDARAMGDRHKSLVQARLKKSGRVVRWYIYVAIDEQTQAPKATCGDAFFAVAPENLRLTSFIVTKADRVVLDTDKAYTPDFFKLNCESRDYIYID